MSCIFWNNVFYITGTDIVRCLTYRFEAFGRIVRNKKKFEEGIFSDLRNLKCDSDATLESPKSEFLEFLYKQNCVRTQKKQKVFHWFSVGHDRLFLDALERDLKREAGDMKASTEAVAEPAKSFKFDPEQSLQEQLSHIIDGIPKPLAAIADATTSNLIMVPTSMQPGMGMGAHHVHKHQAHQGMIQAPSGAPPGGTGQIVRQQVFVQGPPPAGPAAPGGPGGAVTAQLVHPVYVEGPPRGPTDTIVVGDGGGPMSAPAGPTNQATSTLVGDFNLLYADDFPGSSGAGTLDITSASAYPPQQHQAQQQVPDDPLLIKPDIDSDFPLDYFQDTGASRRDFTEEDRLRNAAKYLAEEYDAPAQGQPSSYLFAAGRHFEGATGPGPAPGAPLAASSPYVLVDSDGAFYSQHPSAGGVPGAAVQNHGHTLDASQAASVASAFAAQQRRRRVQGNQRPPGLGGRPLGPGGPKPGPGRDFVHTSGQRISKPPLHSAHTTPARYVDRSAALQARNHYPTPSESGSSEISWHHDYDDLRRATASNMLRASRPLDDFAQENPEHYYPGADMDYWGP